MFAWFGGSRINHPRARFTLMSRYTSRPLFKHLTSFFTQQIFCVITRLRPQKRWAASAAIGCWTRAQILPFLNNQILEIVVVGAIQAALRKRQNANDSGRPDACLLRTVACWHLLHPEQVACETSQCSTGQLPAAGGKGKGNACACFSHIRNRSWKQRTIMD